MDLVIDANILFSILIKYENNEDLLFQEDLHIFAPEFLFEEFEKYKSLILEKTEREEKDFDKFLGILKKKIKIIPNEEIELIIEEAKSICPDEKDIDYFALALKLKCGIWSNDKELKEQNKIKVYSTNDLIQSFKI
ncbi:hypothetical protein J4427_02885 [Candidatus Woesearchaeota archaeon]|nr:hypothetical protein [Candidatus Woesearchaeota archaeon]